MTQRQTRQKPVHTLMEAEAQVYAFRQRALANNEYYDKFKDLVSNAERLGSNIGNHTSRVDAILQAIPEIAAGGREATEAERTQAQETVKDQYLAVMFLINSDKKRYGALVQDIENEYTRGSDTYPTSLSAAYDYIVNYRTNKNTNTEIDEGGVAFYTRDYDDNSARGRGGRGHGGGRGSGGRGRGRGGRQANQPNEIPAQEQMRAQGAIEEDDDEAQFLVDNLDGLEDYLGFSFSFESSKPVVAPSFDSRQADFIAFQLGDPILLLDSCSTLNLISDESMLRDIHEVDKTMHVRCNAGVTKTNLMGWLGDFPEPVWFNPKGVANILSLYIMTKYYHVQFDSKQDNALIVTNPNGHVSRFAPTGKGLYAYSGTSRDQSSAWALVNTVEDRKEEYTKREYHDALLARKIQNIIMFPGVRQFTKIADSKLIPNCPIGRADIAAAERIFGPNLGALKGKTVNRPSVPVAGRIEGVPPSILERYQQVVVSIDIMFVNKIPFFITVSRGLHFGTVENLLNRRTTTVAAALNKVRMIYRRRGFKIAVSHADPEFAPLQDTFSDISFNLCSQDEHVPEIERYIRTVKDRTRSGYNSLPFERIPRLMVIRLICNSVFWLNAFPHADGVSETLSSRYLLTGKHLDYNKHVRLEFGSYVQTHEEHSNDMRPRTIGGICLGPSGNEQGGHYFMSLATGRRLLRDRWTELPMPKDAIAKVNQLGRQQNMPKTLTFADRFGFELPDAEDDIDDDHDSDYDPDDDDQSSDTSTASSQSWTHSSDDDDDEDDDDDRSTHSVPELIAGVDSDDEDSDDEDDEDDDDDSNDDDSDNLEIKKDSDNEDSDNETDDEASDDNDVEPATINIPDETITSPSNSNAGVDGPIADKDDESIGSAGVAGNHEETADEASMQPYAGNNEETADEASVQHDMDARYGPRRHSINLRDRKPRSYKHLFNYNHALLTYEDPMGELFLTEQMSLKKGLKQFGKDGAEAVVAELRQLDYREVIEPVNGKKLSQEQKRKALNYLMYLKQKRCGRIKARGCADGRKQRLYKSKEETTSPTVSTEALFLTSAINAKEGRKVMTIDIPGAFMHADIDELIHIRLEGPMAELLTRVDPEKYRTYMTEERGKKVLYVELRKALYGTLQAAMLFWENLTRFLTEELGFTVNPYDRCVVNKTIDGEQCTIIWHVDDLKLSHVKQEVLDYVANKLNAKYGKEAPLTMHQGAIHDYLGMTIDYSEKGKVKFLMPDYINGILEEAPTDMAGTDVTPASNNLFTVRKGTDKLDDKDAITYHHLTAKMLYLCKRARPDLQTAISFLTTRVTRPDKDDWNKLRRCIRYLRGSKDLFLTLETDNGIAVKWWIDASFAVHPDMRSHTGGTMSLGKGSIYSMSRKQRLNTKSSTEAELVGVDDGMPLVIWTRNFLVAQGFEVRDNVVFQDNQSTILLAKNGKASSGRRTRHIDIRYFFVSDRIARKELRVEYCPTGDMVADFFTKPLQGSLFRKLRKIILNLPDDIELDNVTVSQECVGDMRSYADVVRGTAKESSNVTDTVHHTTRQTVVIGKCKQQQ
jgi:hypothetical protein